MAVYGTVGEYRPKDEEWRQYAEQMDFFLEANGIEDEDRKRGDNWRIIF